MRSGSTGVCGLPIAAYACLEIIQTNRADGFILGAVTTPEFRPGTVGSDDDPFGIEQDDVLMHRIQHAERLVVELKRRHGYQTLWEEGKQAWSQPRQRCKQMLRLTEVARSLEKLGFRDAESSESKIRCDACTARVRQVAAST